MSANQGFHHLKGDEQSDPAALASAILNAEGKATDEFSKEGLAFQRLVLPSMLDAVTRLIPKWGRARVVETLPAFIMPMIVSLLSGLLGVLPKDRRRAFIERYARDLDEQFHVCCARALAVFDGVDPDVMVDAEWARLRAARPDKGGQ